jgi:hypothetical protein
MTQYVGCERARTLLDGLLDGELSMPDQLAVESHLRWCETCALRIEDMRTIGASLRERFASRPVVSDETLTTLNEGLLVRVRAERAQSFPSRIREMLSDRRLLWPALGATAAVVLCVTASVSVLHASKLEDPQSLAGMISALGSPGTERNPLRPADNGISIPRMSNEEGSRAGYALEQISDEDFIYAFRTVVGRDGRPGNSEFLQSDDAAGVDPKALAQSAAQELAMLDVVRQARFKPAQTPMGQAVAVDMVLLFAKTTALPWPPESLRNASAPSTTRAKDTAKPAERVTPAAGVPVSGQPVRPRGSATA